MLKIKFLAFEMQMKLNRTGCPVTKQCSEQVEFVWRNAQPSCMHLKCWYWIFVAPKMTGNLAFISMHALCAIKTVDLVLKFCVLSKIHMGIIENWLHYTHTFTHVLSYNLCERMWWMVIIGRTLTCTHTHIRLFY